MIPVSEASTLLGRLIQSGQTHSVLAFDDDFGQGISLQQLDRYQRCAEGELNEHERARHRTLLDIVGYPLGSDRTFALAYHAFLFRHHLARYEDEVRRQMVDTALRSRAPQGMPGYLFFGSATHRLALQPDTETTSLCAAFLHTQGEPATEQHLLSVFRNASIRFLRPDASEFSDDPSAGIDLVINLYFRNPEIFEQDAQPGEPIRDHGERVDPVSLANLLYGIAYALDRRLVDEKLEIPLFERGSRGSERVVQIRQIFDNNVGFLTQYIRDGHHRQRSRYYVSGLGLLFACSETYRSSPQRFRAWLEPLSNAVLDSLRLPRPRSLLDACDLALAARNLDISGPAVKDLQERIFHGRQDDGYWPASAIYSFGKINKLSFGSVFYSSMKAFRALMADDQGLACP